METGGEDDETHSSDSSDVGEAKLSEAALLALRGLGLLRGDGSVLGREERGEAVTVTATAHHHQPREGPRSQAQEESSSSIAEIASGKGSGAKMEAQSNADFKRHDYWEKRFEEEEEYDWLVRFDAFKTDLIPLLSPSDKILIVGCGNSTFSSDLYDAGFPNIVNIDFSKAVIEAMRDKHGKIRPSMTWLEMDMLDLQFSDAFFDVVLDKAAMDALMVDEQDVWDPARECVLAADRMCRGIDRVLRPGGVHIQISFAQPHFRTKYLMGERMEDLLCVEGEGEGEGAASSAPRPPRSPYSASEGPCAAYHWTLTFKSIQSDGGCLNSFMYIMRKCA